MHPLMADGQRLSAALLALLPQPIQQRTTGTPSRLAQAAPPLPTLLGQAVRSPPLLRPHRVLSCGL